MRGFRTERSFKRFQIGRFVFPGVIHFKDSIKIHPKGNRHSRPARSRARNPAAGIFS